MKPRVFHFTYTLLQLATPNQALPWWKIWKWNLDKSGNYKAKFLSQQLASKGSLHNADLYRNIWRDPIPKKIKFYIWEVSHGSIITADVFPKKTPWIVSAPSWCTFCHKNCESLIHILITCDYTQSFQTRILTAFSYHMVFPNDPLILLQLSHGLPK